MKQLFALCMVFFLSGCYAPWQVEQYVVEKGVQSDVVTSKNKFMKKYEDYIVNDVIVYSFFKGVNEYTKSGTGPYEFVVGAFGKYDNCLLSILNMKVKSSHKKQYAFIKDNFPVLIRLTKEREDSVYCWGGQLMQTHFDFDFSGDEHIEIEIELAIEAKGNRKIETLTYSFKPKLKKGYFQWIEV